MDSEVIEWNLDLPDNDDSRLQRFYGAWGEGDLTKTYSLENFIKGIFYGGVTNRTLKPNYILISKNS